MDKFTECLQSQKPSEYKERALTDRSYKNQYLRENKVELDEKKTNFELATLGDALIKAVLCELYLDRVEKLTKFIERYLTDQVLVEVIAKHYSILDYLKLDERNKIILREYKWVSRKKTKYIATAVEALIGAIYSEDKDLGVIREIVEKWISLIDKSGS